MLMVSQVAVSNFINEMCNNQVQTLVHITVDMYIDNRKPCPTDIATDFGVTVESSLKFTTHIRNIIAKACARANLILKCFISKHTDSLTEVPTFENQNT
jgi:hypothetical protein